MKNPKIRSFTNALAQNRLKRMRGELDSSAITQIPKNRLEFRRELNRLVSYPLLASGNSTQCL